jgi:hypothetical protein
MNLGDGGMEMHNAYWLLGKSIAEIVLMAWCCFVKIAGINFFGVGVTTTWRRLYKTKRLRASAFSSVSLIIPRDVENRVFIAHNSKRFL